MKKSVLILVSCFLLPAAGAADPEVLRLEMVEAEVFQPSKIQTHVYPNGIKLYFLENRELPVVEMSAMMGVGSIHDPADKKGIASFMMSGLRTGGAGERGADQVDEDLETMAAEIRVDAKKEYSTAKLSVLSKDFTNAAPIFFDILTKPRFDPAKLELISQRMQDGIRRRNEDPAEVASREFSQQIYGQESVWARVPTLKTVSAITREDIVQFFQKWVVPQQTWLAVSGDISFEELTKILQPLILNWKGTSPLEKKPAPLAKVWEPSLQLISKPVNQSAVMMGHFGDKRFNPDKYALILANYILGGSTFGSRLGNKIRTELGLAYTVYSDFGFETDYGRFYIAAQTKSESTAEVIEEGRKILAGMLAPESITEKDLEEAKNTILNQLIFQYEDAFQIVEMEARYRFYGYPEDYLTIFQNEIKNVKLEKIREVMSRYFFPDRMKVLVVGNPSLKNDLKKLGPLQELPLDNE